MFLLGDLWGDQHPSLPAFKDHYFPWFVAPSFILQNLQDIVQDEVISTIVAKLREPEIVS
jgi:hypothetical protein